MTNKRKREQLKLQILETERLLEALGGHPVMSFAYEQKLEELQQQLEGIPSDVKEASVALYFSGQPVFGSLGIDVDFIGKALVPFQKMVESDMSRRGVGRVGARGAIKKADDGRLFLTALPRGSFGVELAKLESNSLFDEQQAAESLTHIVKLIDSSSKSDEDFASTLDNVSKRTITGLRKFLKVLSEDNAELTIESGSFRSSLNKEAVQDAYSRVSNTSTQERDVKIQGILKGILVASRRFDFINLSGEKITGAVSNELTEEDMIEFNSSFFNKDCVATFVKTTVTMKNGNIRHNFVLKDIESSTTST